MARTEVVRSEVMGLDFILLEEDGVRELGVWSFGKQVASLPLDAETFDALRSQFFEKHNADCNWFDRIGKLLAESCDRCKDSESRTVCHAKAALSAGIGRSL